MKRFLIFAALAFALEAWVVSCGSKNNDTTATTPTTNCLYANSPGCNGTMYNQYPFTPYPGNYGGYGYGGGGYYGGYYQPPYYGNGYPYSNTGFCQCPGGYSPVYNNSAGLGCVQQQYLAPVAGLVGYWTLQGSNTQWVNIPQVSNIPSNQTSNVSCMNGVAQACVLNQAANCPSGQTCHAVSNTAGICVRQ